MADKKRPTETKGPNDHAGEPIDAPVGYSPRVVKVPMHDKADVNPKYHAAKEEEKAAKTPDVKKGAGWSSKDERMYQHIKDSGASERIAAATVNKRRKKEGRLLHKKGSAVKSATAPRVTLIAKGSKKDDGPGRVGGPGSRGGTIVRYTKKGKPVYQSEFHRNANLSERSLQYWHSAALGYPGREGGAVEAHAHAAFHGLQAAYHHHHAGDEVAAHQAMDYVNHHRSAYEAKEPNLAHGNPQAKWVAQKHEETAKLVGHGSYEAHKKEQAAYERGKTKKAITPSITNGDIMKKNEASDLFKAELGADGAQKPVTHCVHCTRPLTSSDLKKGLGVQFVADDNDNPSSGGSGQVDPSRPGSGVSENDVIAPLLKSCKGPEAGDGEEFPISKSEMEQMGMVVDGFDDGWYTISKSEMRRVGAEEYIKYLDDRKREIAKSAGPDARKSEKPGGVDTVLPKRMQGTGATPPMPKIPPIPHGVDTVKPKRLQKAETDGPVGFTPRAGGAHGPNNEPLVQWYKGSDAEVAKYIEQSGGFGPGTDESIRTEGSGRH